MKMRFVVKVPYLDGEEKVQYSVSDIYEIEIVKTRDGKFGIQTQQTLDHLMNRVDMFGDIVTIERVRE